MIFSESAQGQTPDSTRSPTLIEGANHGDK
jgi:hypothetical protein